MRVVSRILVARQSDRDCLTVATEPQFTAAGVRFTLAKPYTT